MTSVSYDICFVIPVARSIARKAAKSKGCARLLMDPCPITPGHLLIAIELPDTGDKWLLSEADLMAEKRAMDRVNSLVSPIRRGIGNNAQPRTPGTHGRKRMRRLMTFPHWR